MQAQTVDATDRAAMAAWLIAFDDAHPVDLLIANAGVSLSQNDPALERFDKVRRTMAINLDAVLNTVEPLVGGWSGAARGRSGSCRR